MVRATQWFLFALVLAGIFAFFIYRERPTLLEDVMKVVSDLKSPETPTDLYDKELQGESNSSL
jgi:hypothetical protein